MIVGNLFIIYLQANTLFVFFKHLIEFQKRSRIFVVEIEIAPNFTLAISFFIMIE